MSLIPQPQRRNSSDDNMIPLLNIVFLLLIFFMVAGQMRDNIPALELPRSQLGQKSENSSIRIAINGDNEIFLNGQAISIDALSDNFGDTPPAVSVMADRDLQAQQLDNLLNKLRKHGVPAITLLTQKDSL